MPWYDYQCEKCGSVFEVQHAMGESGRVKCKHCGSPQTVKIYSATGVVFKGSGFYVTDSRGRNSAATSSELDSIASATGNGNGHPPAAPAATAEKPAPKSEAKKKAKVS